VADSITLKYSHGGSSLTCEIPILTEKGLTRAEKYQFYPEIVNKGLDGSTKNQYQAFIRTAILRTEPLTSAQLVAILYWGLDNDRLLDYTIDGISESDLSLIADTEYETEWYDDFKMTPFFEVNLQEGVARVDFPNV
jgi:hypothetical protein